MTDEHRSGRPLEASTPVLETRIDTIIQEDQRITDELPAEELQLSVDTVNNIIGQKLKYCKTSARWVTRELPNYHQ